MRGRGVNGWWGMVLDAPDPRALARFYAGILGWRIATDREDWATIHPGQGVAYLGFHLNPDYVPPTWPPAAGHQQMMAHLDLGVADLPAAVADALEAGARLAEYQPQDDVRVMLDPIGHPFCLYTDPDSAAED
ncbi:MAG: VOC family protein [Kineosporiaceae bacterium]